MKVTMKNLILLTLCLMGIFLVSCKKEKKLISNPSASVHINAFPKKVLIYNDFSGAPDSLYAYFFFYKKRDSILLDSFNRDGVSYIKDTSSSMQIDSFRFLYFGNAPYSVSDGLIYSESLLIQYKWHPFDCDGVLPLAQFDFSYNPDKLIHSYRRWTISARCDDHIEDANFDYRKDTLVVNNGRDNYTNYDTIVYLPDENHYSNLPVFSFLYERRVSGFNGTFYYKYLPLFTPFSSGTQKLIHKIICGDFESDYNYTFNTNGDVIQLDVISKEQSGDLGFPQLLQYHVKYVFEY
jgi:hypothetical protein